MLSTVQKLLLAFVTLTVGLVLIGQIASTGNTVTSKTSSSESIDISSARLAGGAINTSTRFYPAVATQATSGWRADTSGCGADTVIVGSYTNASGSALTPTTDYVTNSAGYFTLVNSTTVFYSTNTTVAVLSYCPDGYLSQSWQRSILNLVPGFFAIALLVFAVGMFYSLAKDAGII
jgi:hypothetical protein